MIALVVDIMNDIIFFHKGFEEPSCQVQGDVQEVHCCVVTLYLQGEAMILEDFGNLLLSFLHLPICLGGHSQPIIFISSYIAAPC